MAAERTEMAPAELLRRLRLAIANQPEEVPEGWRTASQWADLWEISSNAAGIVLAKAVKAGLMETRKFRVVAGNRGAYPTVHYKQAKTK